MSTFARRRLVQSGDSITESGNREQNQRAETEIASRLRSRRATQKAAEGGTLRNIYFGERPHGYSWG